MKILYLQMRKDEETANEEFSEFVRFSGLSNDDFAILNVFDTPSFDREILDDHAALFVGGSSDDPDDQAKMNPADFPYIKSCENLILHAYNTNKPTFASCMGFEIAVWTLGGELIVDHENKEIGTYQIMLTPDGIKDPLFENTPEVFWAISGHKKKAKKLPEGAVNLAKSELCPIHAFTFPEKPFYAFQFHPEIDRHDLFSRLSRYLDRGYVDDMESLKKLSKTMKDTKSANELVKRFVDLFIE